MSDVRAASAVQAVVHGFNGPAPMNRAERVVLLGVVGAGVCAVLITAALAGRFSFSTLLDLVVTVTFALFLISPTVAVSMLALAMLLAFVHGWESAAYVALAVAMGVVVRTGSARLIAVYAGLLILIALKMVLFPPAVDVKIEIGLLVAAIVGAAGFLMRSARGREQRLAAAAREQASIIAQIRRDERLLIADELHDVIAHDLTVIAMQARLVEREGDPAIRSRTQREIGDAARRALRDVRRLIVPGLEEGSTERIDGFSATLASMTTTLRNAGYSPEVKSDLSQPVSRLVDAALARVLRESTTNVIKHGAKGTVSICYGADAQTVWLQVRNHCAEARARDRLPSGGFGSARMAERVGLFGGEFVQGLEGDEWVMRATMPRG